MFKVKTEAEAAARYGNIQSGKWSGENIWMTLVDMPDYFEKAVINIATGKPCSRIYMNKDMKEPFLAAIAAVEATGLTKEIKTFYGCWNVRDVRGMAGHPSLHSWGIAVDFRADEMPLGAKSLFSDEFVKCFTNLGFAWGGNFKRLDCQHFSLGYEG